MAARQIL